MSSAYANGVYSIMSAGNISTSTGHHYFKYMPSTGDFVMKASILSQGGTAGMRAGLLATDALSGSGIHAWTARYAGTGEIRYAINGNNNLALSSYASTSLLVRVKIERRGNALYPAASRDGVTWTEASAVSVTPAAT